MWSWETWQSAGCLLEFWCMRERRCKFSMHVKRYVFLVVLRLVLCCIAILSVHGIFIVEQPRQTFLFDHFRWQWLQQRICYVPGCILYMCDFACTVRGPRSYMLAWTLLAALRFTWCRGGCFTLMPPHQSGSKPDQIGRALVDLILARSQGNIWMNIPSFKAPVCS